MVAICGCQLNHGAQTPGLTRSRHPCMPSARRRLMTVGVASAHLRLLQLPLSSPPRRLRRRSLRLPLHSPAASARPAADGPLRLPLQGPPRSSLVLVVVRRLRPRPEHIDHDTPATAASRRLRIRRLRRRPPQPPSAAISYTSAVACGSEISTMIPQPSSRRAPATRSRSSSSAAVGRRPHSLRAHLCRATVPSFRTYAPRCAAPLRLRARGFSLPFGLALRTPPPPPPSQHATFAWARAIVPALFSMAPDAWRSNELLTR